MKTIAELNLGFSDAQNYSLKTIKICLTMSLLKIHF